MNKWQKVINQISKDDAAAFSNSFRSRRKGLRMALSIQPVTFDDLVGYKKWNKVEGIMLKAAIART